MSRTPATDQPATDSQVVQLHDASSGARAAVRVSLGFNCFSWQAPFSAADGSTEVRELLWAEEDFATAADPRPSRSGTPLLFPFGGRISGGRFSFGGRDYQLETNDPLGNAIHGYALSHAWRVVEQSEASVTAEFRPAIDAPRLLEGSWTGDYRIRATYSVAGGELLFDFSAENLSDRPMPFWFGTHAYFRLQLADTTNPAEVRVSAPVAGTWLDENLIPTGECPAVAEDHPLRIGAALGDATYDTPFQVDPSQPLVTELYDPSSGRRVRQSCDDSMISCVVYTPGHREAICLEPYTAVPNAFALEEQGVASGLRVLESGGKYTTRIVCEATS